MLYLRRLAGAYRGILKGGSIILKKGHFSGAIMVDAEKFQQKNFFLLKKGHFVLKGGSVALKGGVGRTPESCGLVFC